MKRFRRSSCFLFRRVSLSQTLRATSRLKSRGSTVLTVWFSPTLSTLPTFQSSFQQSFTPMNTAVASQLALLPFASPASGLIYTFNSSAGVYTR